MSKSKSSRHWLDEHVNDAYVKLSKKEGFRSRASYKLVELDKKDRLLLPGMTVVDLGAAPGGWSQVAAAKVGGKGRVLASDVLPMVAIADVDFIQGDFTQARILEQILSALGSQRADLVISDMAPNMSGMVEVDQPKSLYLVELALDLAQRVLKNNGTFVSKVFQGEGFDQLLREARSLFQTVVARKPGASRPRSREVYMVARGFKGG